MRRVMPAILAVCLANREHHAVEFLTESPVERAW